MCSINFSSRVYLSCFRSSVDTEPFSQPSEDCTRIFPGASPLFAIPLDSTLTGSTATVYFS
uniref:ORF60 n=1 Tax=Leptospirillum ferrooxidans TaxID=180 RepID=Q58KE2_9BACT|nr:ORF60 [Leptospirillum ferrooxidans]